MVSSVCTVLRTTGHYQAKKLYNESIWSFCLMSKRSLVWRWQGRMEDAGRKRGLSKAQRIHQPAKGPDPIPPVSSTDTQPNGTSSNPVYCCTPSVWNVFASSCLRVSTSHFHVHLLPHCDPHTSHMQPFPRISWQQRKNALFDVVISNRHHRCQSLLDRRPGRAHYESPRDVWEPHPGGMPAFMGTGSPSHSSWSSLLGSRRWA